MNSLAVWDFFSLFLDFSPYEQMIILARNSALPSLILHRYSISTPYQVHRFDGVTMEMRWSNDGETSEFQGTIFLFICY